VATSASFAALALSQSLQMQMFINRVTVQFADVETKLNAIERLNGTHCLSLVRFVVWC
jgi:hypothetical protein